MSKAKYIIIEGLDGSGKTTQFNKLIEYLGDATVAIHEPGSTPMSEHIRTLVKAKAIPRDPHTNIFLFAAARADLISSIIRPAIADGKTVVSDRNWLSAAYQIAEGANLEAIIQLNQLAAGEFFVPDFVILIDTDPVICRERMGERGDHSADYFDTKGLEFFEKARQVYIQQMARFDHKVIVNGNQPQEQVWTDIKAAIQPTL